MNTGTGFWILWKRFLKLAPTTLDRNSDYLTRRAAAVPRGVANATDVFAARAENAEVWDVEGTRYIDFAGGIGAVPTSPRF